MRRKLAAILAADVVGYTGLVARNEDDALARVGKVLDDVVEMQVGANRGRVFKSMGDGILAEFSSTAEAVNCAIGIQQMMAAAEREDAGDALRLRIGVSLGDVVVRGDDLLGDGVNIATRLEQMAEPGGIAVSGEVMARVRDRIDLPLEDCGYQKVKESDAPIRVYMTREQRDREGRGIFDFDRDALGGRAITGQCLCGAVQIEIGMPPISSGYCHCRICQKFSGSAMSCWTAFPVAGVRFPAAQPRFFASSPIAERGFCPDCGSSLVYRLIKPRPAAYMVVFTASLDQPENFAPAAHSGTESQVPWLEILDDLPRTTSANSRVLQEAWGSVGLPEPEHWGPRAKVPDVF